MVIRLDGGALGREPLVPGVRHLLLLRGEVRVLRVADGLVQSLEPFAVLFEIFGDVILRLLGQERRRSRPPQKLVKTLALVLVQQPSVEGPHVEAVLHLVHRRHRRGDVPTGRIPLHVSRHEVLGARHGFHLVHVEKLKLAVHGLQARQDDDFALRGPKQTVRGFVLDGADELDLVHGAAFVDHGVERHVGSGAVAVNHRKPVIKHDVSTIAHDGGTQIGNYYANKKKLTCGPWVPTRTRRSSPSCPVTRAPPSGSWAREGGRAQSRSRWTS